MFIIIIIIIIIKMPSLLYVQQILTQVFIPHTKTKMKAYRSFATTVSQLKISDFSGETIKAILL